MAGRRVASTRGIAACNAFPFLSHVESFQVSGDRYHFLTSLRAAVRNSNVIQL